MALLGMPFLNSFILTLSWPIAYQSINGYQRSVNVNVIRLQDTVLWLMVLITWSYGKL